MDAIRLLERAQDWTGAIVSGVRADDLTENTPCSEWDVATLLDHLIAEQETFNRVASGEALDLVASFDPNAPENKGRGWPDPGTTFEQLVKEAREIWSVDGALEKTLRTSNGEIPGAMLMNIYLTDTLVHGWDLAKATGQDTEMPADVAEAVLGFTSKAMKERRIGFGDPIPVPDDASVTERLVGWLGRTP